MKSDAAGAKEQEDALPALQEYLTSGEAALVRGAQALLVDPEQPGASKRALFTPLWKALEDHWRTAGTGDEEDILRLQAMLVASWPERRDTLAPALLSPWAHLEGREQQREALCRWRDERAGQAMTGLDGGRKDELLELKPFDRAAKALSNLGAEGSVFNREAHEKQMPQPAWGSVLNPSFGPTVEAEFQRLRDPLATLIKSTRKNLARIQDFMSEGSPLVELLWWGQARYSHIARKPFRRISNQVMVLWLAAREAAERAYELPIEPAASYLQETLFSLGRSPTERRPLRLWASELREAVTIEPLVTLSDDLRALLEEDAFGLPVSLLCANPLIDDEHLHAFLGAPADALLDEGEWAAWIFRELVFQRRWLEASR